MNSKLSISWLKIFVFIPAILVLGSLFSLLIQALKSTELSSLFSFFISHYSLNSLILTICVGMFSLIIGTSLAAVISFYKFPGSKILEWLLVLPLAFPGYVMAYAYVSLLDYAGPVQSFLRAYFHENSTFFLPIRSTAGLMMVLTFCLYPYVYLLARSAFQSLGKNIFEAARSLKIKPIPSFFKVTLPNSWPWLLSGVSIVGMETLADFGTVSVFNYQTLTIAIYKSWLGHYSLANASLICFNLLGWIAIIYFLLKKIQSNHYLDQSWVSSEKVGRIKLKGIYKIIISMTIWGFFFISFVLPLSQILYWAYEAVQLKLWQSLGKIFYHSMITGILACFLLTTIAFLANLNRRFFKSKLITRLNKISQIGYALPGSILAIAVFIPLIFFDHLLADISEKLFNYDLPLILTGSIFALLVGYLVRFYTLPFRAIANDQKRLPKEIDQVASTLGCSKFASIFKIHLPALKGGLLTAMILVFVDVLKEMPLTLMTRPFGWDTLAVRIFEMTSEGDWAQAAIPALSLVILGMIPVRFLIKKSV